MTFLRQLGRKSFRGQRFACNTSATSSSVIGGNYGFYSSSPKFSYRSFNQHSIRRSLPIGGFLVNHRYLSTKSESTEESSSMDSVHSEIVGPMDRRLLFQYLQLKRFTRSEMEMLFDRIHLSHIQRIVGDNSLTTISSKEDGTISHGEMTSFIFERIKEIDEMQMNQKIKLEAGDKSHHDHVNNEYFDPIKQRGKEKQMITFAELESHKAMELLLEGNKTSTMTRSEFEARLTSLATDLDASKTIPISVSMLLVGSSVGIIIPIMPYVVSNLGLTAGQYGIVVSSFAFAKLFANVPAAVLVERHGRKPYLVYSLVVISMGVGGIGLASEFEHLLVCRTLTGVGVSLLSTAATLTIADCSTPLNRARTMAPMLSAFAAGTALGPAVGGLMADSVGVNSTFYLVGGIYLALTSVNKMFLSETKMIPEIERSFPWHERELHGKKKIKSLAKKEDDSVLVAMLSAMSDWKVLLANPKIRNVVMMNGFYWVALSGSQMTLLPLILTDPSGLAMSATSVGKVYMGMSLVQVLGNPTMASLVDRMGKVPGIVTGCGLLSASMFALPFCSEIEYVAGTLGIWALGSTMLSTAPTAYISDHVQEKERAQAIALLRTAGDIGFLFGASSTGAVSDLFGMDVG
eukprot:CAMPEP_0194115640 /NCGR_PEP_ID=MMETSP0150-20130528/24220_1 /TAXON_ID=122233 /ORGANISM="Chaetoceros debilis, Strain MM31A-1" /LENGTH=631 /DNA_ID=CAMNT_0038806175 /DNA_START=21 /DNA_END=1912 /DNA_ORIENTATION=+